MVGLKDISVSYNFSSMLLAQVIAPLSFEAYYLEDLGCDDHIGCLGGTILLIYVGVDGTAFII